MSVHRPTVVLVHGFLDSPSTWASVTKLLDYPTLAVDLSDPSTVSLDAYADTAADAIRRSEARQVLLVGHSMGAQVAELTVGRIPEVGVSGLILISPVPLQGMLLPGEMADALRGCGENPDLQRGLRQQLSANLSEEDMNAIVSSGSLIPRDDVAAMFDAWSGGHPAGGTPTTVTAPVTIFAGQLDPFISPAVLDEVITPRFPDAHRLSVPGSGHWPPLEQPAAVASRISDAVDAATEHAQ